MRKYALGAGLLIALTSTDLAAQQTACSLLSSADILAAIEVSAADPHKTDTVIQQGPQKGQTTLGCMWRAGDQGMVTAMLMHAVQGPARDSGLATMRHAYDALKAQQWTEEKRDFATGSCSVMTPPTSQKDVPILAQCFTEVKGMVLAVGFMSPTKKLSLAQIKALLDRAVGHLP